MYSNRSLLSRIFLGIALLSMPVYSSLELIAPIIDTVEEERKDPFAWQNEKHFALIMHEMAEVAEREFQLIVTQLIEKIEGSDEFFKQRHATLLNHLRNTIFDWMNDKVLSQEAYFTDEVSLEMQGFETEEDCWRIAFMEGYERYDESEEESGYESDDAPYELSPEEEAALFEDELYQWHRNELLRTLGIMVSDMEDFTRESIDIAAIKNFLTQSVQGGYSWLINEMVGGSMLTNEEFVEKVHEEIAIKNDLLLSILEGLWFDYDWEECDIEDPLFVAHTYVSTLKALQQGQRAADIKEHIISSIAKLFTFNEEDFQGALAQIQCNYNKYVEQYNWLGAFIEWSIYTVYRKVFAQKISLDELTKSTEPLLPRFEEFNRDTYVIDELRKARTRAHDKYKKLYLHESVTKLVYVDELGRRGELAFAELLTELKQRGKTYEPHRPGGKENVFIPKFYLIVQKDGEPLFIQVPLDIATLGLPSRPVTRLSSDGVFTEARSQFSSYFAQVKKDYVYGRIVQGHSQQSAMAEITSAINNRGCKYSWLVHSERVIMELLRKQEVVRLMVQSFVDELLASQGEGVYTVHGVVMLAYSTNSVCRYCTPTLVSLMNSHMTGGFLNMLMQELQEYEDDIVFMVPEKDTSIDRTKFRLHMFITARINFDCDAHDITEEGHHMHNRVKNPTSYHNPHAKICRPQNEFILSHPILNKDGVPDPYQRYFCEFVGKGMHVNEDEQDFEDAYKELVCSSGSKLWKNGPGY